MLIRQHDVTEADKKSAETFFSALNQTFDLKNMDVLDAFARNGQLTVSSYCRDVKSVTCWELSPEHEVSLRQYTDKVKIGDSYAYMSDAILAKEKWDCIVIDTPQGLHSDSLGRTHAEHFKFLEMSLGALRNRGIVVLYVNKRPYDKNVLGSHGYDQYSEYNFADWMAIRESFYGSVNVDTQYALEAYSTLLFHSGWVVENVLVVPCSSDVPDYKPYAFRLALEVRKK